MRQYVVGGWVPVDSRDELNVGDVIRIVECEDWTRDENKEFDREFEYIIDGLDVNPRHFWIRRSDGNPIRWWNNDFKRVCVDFPGAVIEKRTV